MKVKSAILSCLLMTSVFSVSAQEQGTTVYDFNPHWYIQGQIGGQYTLGEVPFSDLLSPNAQLGIGYNFTPAFGVRLSANGWQSKGGSTFIDSNEAANWGTLYEWKWKYVAPSLDLTLNLSNLIGGFNPTRLFNVGIFAGAGANIAMNNDEAFEQNALIMARPNQIFEQDALEYLWNGTQARFAGRFGANIDCRLSNAVSLGIELQANCLNDEYNSKKAYNPDWYFNALIGLKINLGKTHTTRYIAAPEPEIRYVEKTVEKVVEKQAPCPEKETGIRRDIFFSINSTEITAAEATKVAEIAEYLKNNPGSFVSIVGVADAGTGNDRINNRLASQRAAVVVKALKEKYGIAAERISSSSNGSKVQPFKENDKNRVTICIAE